MLCYTILFHTIITGLLRPSSLAAVLRTGICLLVHSLLSEVHVEAVQTAAAAAGVDATRGQASQYHGT